MCCRVGRLLPLFGLLCLVSQINGQENRLTCGRRRVKSVYLIHNGIDAKAGHWPWHAAIFHRKQGVDEYACGGVIIDESTILTAAHCVFTMSGKIPLNRIVVSVGQIDLKEENEFTQKHSLQDTIIHPKYSSASITNDIALLKLSTNITMNKYVQPVCLWTMDSNQEMIVGRNGTVVGFGLNEDDVVSNQLKQALIGVVDALTCIASDRSVFGTHLTSDIYCGRGQIGVSACNGDSGGGMFFEVGGKWFVRGLVSFIPLRGNTGLCDPLKYTAYTDVAKYFEWIVPYVDQRVLSFESDVLDIDYEEKLRLFNFDSCGEISSTLLSNGRSWTLPWLGFVIFSRDSDNTPNARCTVTLISEWYAIGPAHCFDNDGLERYILLGGDSESSTSECVNLNGTTTCNYPTQTLQIERIITHPKYDSNSLGDNIVLIELLKSANTTLPNVRPICITATPELRTTQMINLSVASFSTQANSYRSEAVSLVNTDYCKTQYDDLGFTINWKNKRFCARTPEEASCSSLKGGAPLQELRSFGDTSRYFLRGFELFGRACATEISPAYNNIDEYLDWILYNMRYNILDRAGSVAPSSIDNAPKKQSLDEDWEALQQQPGKEKLRLFNMTTCGLPALRNQNLGRVTILPWVGFFQGAENVTDEASFTKSLAVLISEWYAIAPSRSVTSNITWRLLILGKYNPDDPTNCYTSTCEITHQLVEIKNVIIPPIGHPRQGLALIELLEPANLKIPYIRPICLPFMQQLYRNTPSEVTISSNRQFDIVSKKLTMIDYLNCQQRLLLATHFVTFDGDFPCAIEAEKFRQVSLSSRLGSPLQMPVRMGGRTRYFLYGMDTNQENIFEDLVYGPYLFSTIELADLDWIVENMQFKEQHVTLPIETRDSDSRRVSMAPVHPDTSKSNLFDFDTCGINTLLSESSDSYPTPWRGDVFSNEPFFNVSRCSVTLVSEWHAVGPAYCFGDVKQKHYILFGLSGDATSRECTKSNTTATCELPTQRILVEKVIIHPQYDRVIYSNDIALVKLARPVDTSQPNVKPICLPVLNEARNYDLSDLVMSFTNATNTDLAVARVDNRYLPQDECKQRWKGLAVSFTVDSTKSCVITKRSSEDNCVGLFTGAALHTLQKVQSTERHFLRGFVLILPRGCSVYYPAVYINTDHYLNWIVENMDEPLYPSDDSAHLQDRLIFN